MPFTPFHMGAALVIKPAARRCFSVFAFGAAQIVMDLEPLIGMLRGAEQSQAFSQASSGQWQTSGQPTLMRPGDVEAVSPSIGDVHQVCNAVEHTSVSIHVYGGNIGATPRSVFTEDGREASFISGYNNSQLPNLWDSSRDRTVNN